MAEIFLPSDIKTKIFSLLPVDSILQCKCVCKTWRSLIDELLKDPSFVDTHTRRFLSPSPSPSHAASSYISFLAREKSPATCIYHLLARDNDNNNDWSIVGTCNGLVCLVRKRYDFLRRLNVCICNPVTREYVNLLPQYNLSPSDPKFYQMPVVNQIIGTGFGYVPSTNEYKFVRITCDRENVYVSVYTLGSGTWRMKKVDQLMYCDIESRRTTPTPGLFFNGALYWSRNSLRHGIEITSFDLENEEFRVVPSPPQSKRYINKSIGVLISGCFCVIRKDCSDGSKDILVMKKEEEEEEVYTWTKEFRIKPAMEENITPPFAREANIFPNYDYMKFASYYHHLNNSNSTMNSSMVDYWFEMLLPYVSRFEMIPYMRSLVSLKALEKNDAAVATTKRKRVDIYDSLALAG